MAQPRIYGAMVRSLPVSQKSKNWLMRNWIGGLIGALFYLLLLFSPYILNYEVTDSNRWIPTFPIGLVYTPTGDIMMGQIPIFQVLFVLIGNLIIWAVIGTIIQSWLRKK